MCIKKSVLSRLREVFKLLRFFGHWIDPGLCVLLADGLDHVGLHPRDPAAFKPSKAETEAPHKTWINHHVLSLVGIGFVYFYGCLCLVQGDDFGQCHSNGGASGGRQVWERKPDPSAANRDGQRGVSWWFRGTCGAWQLPVYQCCMVKTLKLHLWKCSIH